MMSRQDAYEVVNKCETYEELAKAIREIGEDGIIQGRIRPFDSEKMAVACENFDNYMELKMPNVLTREFGIRQQAMYIYYFENR
jgi:hypothetical protein